MKKGIFYTCILVATLLAACTSQDDIYKEFVVEGGHSYPAKAVDVNTVAGFQRVSISWSKPKDPAVVNSRLYWNSRADSIDVAYNSDGKAEYTVTGLEDRSYTFYIVNFDKNGNRSLEYEVTASPYGSNWLISHSERSASGVWAGDSTVIVFSSATFEMVSTRLAYMNDKGQVVEYPEAILPEQDTLVLKDAMKGKKFFTKSTYCPAGGTDEVENTSWIKSSSPILYPLDVSSWTVSATANQVLGAFTPDKIFDGQTEVVSGRYISNNTEAYRAIFPKILSIDTHAQTGMEPTILSLDFYQHPSGSTYRYIRDIAVYVGDNAYDPDATEVAIDTDYGSPAASLTLSTSRQVQTVSLRRNNTGRYMSIVFKNSYNIQAYFIDLWELVPFGYIEGASEIDYPTF